MLKKALVGALEVLGKRWKSIGKALERCWNLPVERKSISVRFPVRGQMFYCSVSGCMQVLITYLPRQTLILVLSSERVLMRTFPELVFRTTLTWRPFLGRLSMFSNWSRL